MMKTMLFSVSYAGLWGQHALDLPAFIRKAAALGYDAVELMAKRPHLSVLDWSEEGLAELRGIADDCGVQIATVAGYTDFTGGRNAPEVPFAEMQVAHVRELARMAQVLGAGIVRVFTGYTTDARAYHDDWTRCVSGLRECAEAAQAHGVMVGVQNHHDVGVGWRSYLELLDDIDHPHCKAMFDPWSVALHGADLRECAEAVAPRMVQTTLADYVKLERYQHVAGLVNYERMSDMVRAVPAGDGFIDFDAFFAGLKAGGFSGYVAYEMCSPLRGGGGEENLDATARKSLARMKELIQ